MKRSHQIVAIAAGGSFGALVTYGLRVMQLDLDRRTSDPTFDVVSILCAVFGFGVGAVCGLFFVPGKNPWRW